MLTQLLDALKSFDGAEYLIRETKNSRRESYNIKKQSEMRRSVETTRLHLTLYRVFSEDGKKYRGSYSTEIHPGTSQGELRSKLEQAFHAAGFVKNEYFPLVEPSGNTGAVAETRSDGQKAVAGLEEALYSQDCFDGGHLSYSEFFVNRSRERIVNSNGLDVSYASGSLFVETAVHWKGEREKEIEILESYRSSLPLTGDTSAACKMLKDGIAQLFSVAQKKSLAGPTPKVSGINILLSGECLVRVFDYYRFHSNAQMVYQKFSTFEEGGTVQGEGDCDRITLTLDPAMQGSGCSRPYDEHGLPLEKHVIIKDGRLQKYWGNTRFASYLKIKPTGNIENIHVTGGSFSDVALRKEPYLELVSFSDFQVNPVTGDFGSEIRLGFYFDGEKTVPVTGGSVSGNIAAVQNSFKMSVEERQYDNYRGPATVCLRGASVSGV